VRRIRRQVVIDQRCLERSVGVIGLYVLIAIVSVLDELSTTSLQLIHLKQTSQSFFSLHFLQQRRS